MSIKKHVPGRTAKRYGVDKSGTISYLFNSAGYRSEELDPKARFRICVVGESNALGTGIAFECTFGQRFKFHYCRAHGLPDSSVNVINLAVGGMSADYCVRALIRQMDAIRPNLIIAHFPKCDRIENIDWNSAKPYSASAIDVNKLEEAPIALLGFLDFYSEPFGRMNTVRNALLLQSVCQVRNIELIISSNTLKAEKYQGTIIEPLYTLLDKDNLLTHEILSNSLDKAADGKHAGPRSHEMLAIALLDKFAILQSRRLESERPGNLRATELARQVKSLKDENPEWAEIMKQKITPS